MPTIKSDDLFLTGSWSPACTILSFFTSHAIEPPPNWGFNKREALPTRDGMEFIFRVGGDLETTTAAGAGRVKL